MRTSLDEKILAYLNTDRLKHLTHLKYLSLYSKVIRQNYSEAGGQIGLLLSYPTQAVSWDRTLYPGTNHVLLPTASDSIAAERLATYAWEQFSTELPVVIKFCDATTKAAFGQAFPLRFADTYLSFSAAPDTAFELPKQVVRSDQLTDSCAALFVSNGYDYADLEAYFIKGAVSFAIYEQNRPQCVCMVFQNYDTIWEIGGVQTIVSARRKGYARQVVQAALYTLLAQGKIPRYMVSAQNAASVQLAEGLGLQLCLRFEHYVVDRL